MLFAKLQNEASFSGIFVPSSRDFSFIAPAGRCPPKFTPLFSDPEYEEIEQRCSKCRSAGHSTRSCPRCERCKNQSHRGTECPLIVEKEVENHFNKPMNELPNEQLDCIFQLNDKIMKWYVTRLLRAMRLGV
jgi:hypothetical protein